MKLVLDSVNLPSPNIHGASAARDAFEKCIKSAINVAIFCNDVSDCVHLPTDCPFGCNLYVNKMFVQDLTELMGDYSPYADVCEYACKLSYGVECRDHQCTVLYEPPQSSSTQ